MCVPMEHPFPSMNPASTGTGPCGGGPPTRHRRPNPALRPRATARRSRRGAGSRCPRRPASRRASRAPSSRPPSARGATGTPPSRAWPTSAPGGCAGRPPAASSPLPRSCPATAPGPTATAGAITTFMGTSSERLFNGSGKGYLPAGAIGNRSRILSERLKAGTESKRLKKGHRPAPMPQRGHTFCPNSPRPRFESMHGCHKRKAPVAGGFKFDWCGV